MKQPDHLFEETRPKLLGLAYRILGSYHDAEDVVQDVCEIWLKSDRKKIRKSEQWLTTVCTRRAIDRLRALKRMRHTYIGEWLPEPVQSEKIPNAEDQILLSETLTTAFLLILDQLTPKERVAYLLHDIFGQNYQEIAQTLEIAQSACRQLVSRARKKLRQNKLTSQPAPSQQDQLVGAFHQAIQLGDVERLKNMLAADVTLYADSGGKAEAISKPVHGEKAVGKFFDKVLLPIWNQYDATFEPIALNGQTGLIQRVGKTITATVSFAFDARQKTRAIYITRNPDKLSHLYEIDPTTPPTNPA